MLRNRGFLLDRSEDTRLFFRGDCCNLDDVKDSVGVAVLCMLDETEDTVLARLLGSVEFGEPDLRNAGRSIIEGFPMNTTDTTMAVLSWLILRGDWGSSVSES